ncbi:MAG: efflux RND transporter periplasmic adaptor subunit [Methylococcales bacterium]|nr:efflux RND transporter periplasmic adaptor subunit [Methylococcales bacterium]MBT7444908.1 efflux RND transporter periplasmic adaptor subunit [Methylococcales bacterium]
MIFPEVEAPGSVVSLNDSAIGASVNGVVMSIPAKVGDLVAGGAILVKLDSSDLSLEKKRLNIRLKRVQKQKAAADSDLARKQRLGNKISKVQLRQAETEAAVLALDYQDTAAQLQLAKNKLVRTTIRAPFRGIVTERLGRVGEFVSPGKSLIRIVDVENIEVTANVQTKDVGSLEKAKKIAFLYDGVGYPLVVRSVVRVRNQKTRTQEVRLSFVKKQELPGTAGRLRWTHTQPHIPPELLVRRKGQLGVFILKNKKAHFLELKGALEGRPVYTTLSKSTLIIIKGRYSIKDGTVLKK